MKDFTGGFLPPEANPDFFEWQRRMREQGQPAPLPPTGVHQSTPQAPQGPQQFASPAAMSVMNAPAGTYVPRVAPTAASFYQPPAPAPAPQRPRTATSTRRNTSKQTSTAIGGEQDIALAKDAWIGRQEAIERQQSLMEAEAEQKARKAELDADAAGRAQARIASRSQESEARSDRVLAEVESVSAEVMNAPEANDFWADKSTGTKIAAAIALGLGGFGSALTGGPNDALRIIEAAKDRDFQAARARQADRKDVARGKMDFLKLASSITDDEVSRDLIAKKLQDDVTTSQIERMAAALGTEKAAALAAEASAANNQKAAETMSKLRDRQVVTEQTRTVTGQARPQATAAGTAASLGGAQVVNPELAAFTLQDKPTYRSFLKEHGATVEIASDVAEMESIARDINGYSIKPGDRRVKRYNALHANLAPKYSVAFGQGAQTDADAKRFSARFPELDSTGSRVTLGFGNVDTIASERSAWETSAQNRFRITYGVTPAFGGGNAQGPGIYSPGVAR